MVVKENPDRKKKYLDASNLFGSAMSQHLPYGESEWLNQEEIDGFDVNSVAENSLHGYICCQGFVMILHINMT